MATSPSSAVQFGLERAQTAADHADREEPGWSERAYELLIDFVQSPSSPRAFQTEDIVDIAQSLQGLPEPPDRRAWGAVVSKAARNGVIRRVGYAPDAYGSPKSLWEAVR